MELIVKVSYECLCVRMFTNYWILISFGLGTKHEKSRTLPQVLRLLSCCWIEVRECNMRV